MSRCAVLLLVLVGTVALTGALTQAQGPAGQVNGIAVPFELAKISAAILDVANGDKPGTIQAIGACPPGYIATKANGPFLECSPVSFPIPITPTDLNCDEGYTELATYANGTPVPAGQALCQSSLAQTATMYEEKDRVGEQHTFVLQCPDGYVVTGGGYRSQFPVLRSEPVPQNRWVVQVKRQGVLTELTRAWAQCLQVASD